MAFPLDGNIKITLHALVVTKEDSQLNSHPMGRRCHTHSGWDWDYAGAGYQSFYYIAWCGWWAEPPPGQSSACFSPGTFCCSSSRTWPGSLALDPHRSCSAPSLLSLVTPAQVCRGLSWSRSQSQRRRCCC